MQGSTAINGVRMRQSVMMAARNPFLSYAKIDNPSIAKTRPISEAARARESREVAMAHELAACAMVRDFASVFAGRALRYVELRASATSDNIYNLLHRIQRPVALPFAGRADSVSTLYRFLLGEGNVRETMSAVWLTMSHLVTEDLVGPLLLPGAFDLCLRAGFAESTLLAWTERTLACSCEKAGHEIAWEGVDPYDLFRLIWHPVRQAQLNSRVQIVVEPAKAQRHWSQTRRADWVAEGGIFSRTERVLRSPLGEPFLPWMDACRLFCANPASELHAHAVANDIPLKTGTSGVAVQLLLFAELFGLSEGAGAKSAIFSYLMTIGAHSYYELVMSTGHYGDTFPPLDYESHLN